MPSPQTILRESSEREHTVHIRGVGGSSPLAATTPFRPPVSRDMYRQRKTIEAASYVLSRLDGEMPYINLKNCS